MAFKGIPMRRFILKAPLFLFLTACAAASDSPSLALAASEGSDASEADRQALEYRQVGEFLYQALPFLENKRYIQIKAMKGLQRESRLGVTSQPNESCVAEPSYIEGQSQQRCTLIFQGLELSGVVNEGQLALNHAVITSRKWQLKWRLNVGTPLVNLKATFKQSPVQPTPNVLQYGNESSSVSFSIKDGLIARVELNIYDG